MRGLVLQDTYLVPYPVCPLRQVRAGTLDPEEEHSFAFLVGEWGGVCTIVIQAERQATTAIIEVSSNGTDWLTFETLTLVANGSSWTDGVEFVLSLPHLRVRVTNDDTVNSNTIRLAFAAAEEV